MSYLPPVVARLSMDLGDFDAKLDEAKAKINSLSANEKVRITYDTRSSRSGNPLTDLEKIAREASRINNKAVMSLKLADGTRTWEQLIAIDREMARLNGRTARVNVKVNKSDLNQVDRLFSKLGSLFGGGHSFNLPFTNMTANPAGLAGIVGGIAALLPELAGVVSGFAAAGAGAAAFYVLAHPAIKNLETDITNLSGARTKLQTAQNAYAIDPSKLNLKALQKAQDQLKAIKMSMSQDAGGAAGNLIKLQAEYGKLTTAFKPEAFKVFNSGLKLAADLLPTLTPFAHTFADGLSRIFSNLDKSSKGKGFQDFLKGFHSIEGPALSAIGAGIGNVAGSIGRLLTVMSGKDVAHALNIAFSGISGTIGVITGTIKVMMSAWDGASARFKSNVHGIASAFDNVRHGLASMGDSIAHAFTGIPGSIASIASKIAAPFASIPGKIKGFFAGAGGWLVSAGQYVISGFAKGAQDAWNAFNGWLGGIPGKVIHFFAGAGGWLVSAGQAIMQGFLNGLQSMWGKVKGFVSGIAGWIKTHKGPLDYDAMLLYPHGQAIMDGLMGGLGSRQAALTSQLKGITQQIQGAGWVKTAGPALAGSGGHAVAGGGVIELHNHVHLDSREIYSSVQKQAVSTQRNTGQTGLTKRTR